MQAVRYKDASQREHKGSFGLIVQIHSIPQSETKIDAGVTSLTNSILSVI